MYKSQRADHCINNLSAQEHITCLYVFFLTMCPCVFTKSFLFLSTVSTWSPGSCGCFLGRHDASSYSCCHGDGCGRFGDGCPDCSRAADGALVHSHPGIDLCLHHSAGRECCHVALNHHQMGALMKGLKDCLTAQVAASAAFELTTSYWSS